jgi:hypothetical protein
MDMHPIRFDISRPVEAYRFSLVLQRLVNDHAPKLREEFVKVQGALESRLRTQGMAACRWRHESSKKGDENPQDEKI